MNRFHDILEGDVNGFKYLLVKEQRLVDHCEGCAPGEISKIRLRRNEAPTARGHTGGNLETGVGSDTWKLRNG